MSDRKSLAQAARGFLCFATSTIMAVGATACGQIHLYDPTRAELARTAVQQVEQTDLDKLSLRKEKFLDAHLAYSLTAADETSMFLLQNDLFRMAASDDATLHHWRNAALSRISALGFGSAKTLQVFRIRQIDEGARAKRAADAQVGLKALLGESFVRVAECTGYNDPSEWPALEDLGVAENDLEAVRIDYEDYKKSCVAPDGAGALGAHNRAQREVDKLDQDALAKKVAVRKVREEIDKIGENESRITDALTGKASKVHEALKDVKELGVLPEDGIAAVQLVLGQLLGEKADVKAKLTPELGFAVAIARQLPALTADMDALLTAKNKPPTAHLVIELQRQLVLIRFNVLRREILVKRAKLFREIYDARTRQASAYLEFATQICNYAFRGEPNDDANKLDACIFGGSDTASSDDTWSTAIVANGLKGRQASRAIIALSDAHNARATELKAEFRINDLYYRENVLASESAVAQWHNLIKIPADQIVAFYESGIKPEVFSDFIVKLAGLAGLTAVALD